MRAHTKLILIFGLFILTLFFISRAEAGGISYIKIPNGFFYDEAAVTQVEKELLNTRTGDLHVLLMDANEGGRIDLAVRIIDAIKKGPGEVQIECFRACISSAAYVWIHADYKVIPNNAILLFHGAREVKVARSTGEVLETIILDWEHPLNKAFEEMLLDTDMLKFFTDKEILDLMGGKDVIITGARINP